jgi:plasmid maintenance system killer protein
MEIEIPDNSLKRSIEDDRRRVRKFGTDMASKIAIRMAALTAAQSLADFWPPLTLPERCHELKGQLKGLFSIDLKHPFRLLFRPIETEEVPGDELERWKKIREIEIVGIEDTHG